MVSDNKQFKVFNSVVSTVSVDVVNVFPSFEVSAKMCGHNEAMLKYVDASSDELNISVKPDGSSDIAVFAAAAPQRAKLRPLGDSRLLDVKDGSTSWAGDIWHSRHSRR